MGRSAAVTVKSRKHATPVVAPTRPQAAAVLRLIWRERHISRAEIAQWHELSRSTVSDIVSELLATDLVREVGAGPSRGGRRPIVLQFEDDAYGILGVDMGATHVAVTVTNLRGQVIAWEAQGHPVRTDPEGTRSLITKLAEACLARWGRRERLIGIGVGVPSPIDPRSPRRLSQVVMPAWGGASGLEALEARFGVPVLVDNDANLGALAERWWGAAREADDVAYVKLGTGIGSGHIIGGEIYRGASGIAGEIGHLAIDVNGPPCVCGLRGCLATFIGKQALVAHATELLARLPDSTLAGGSITVERIEEAALRGDELALEVVRTAARRLAIAVAGMLNLMNPSVVVIGGGLARLGELLLAPLREGVGRHSLVSSMDGTRIVTSELGPRAVAIGAATLVLQSALSDLRHFPLAARERR